jgi:hypothetical protein
VGRPGRGETAERVCAPHEGAPQVLEHFHPAAVMRQLCTGFASRMSALRTGCWFGAGLGAGSSWRRRVSDDGGWSHVVVLTRAKRRVRMQTRGSLAPCALLRMSRTDLDVAPCGRPSAFKLSIRTYRGWCGWIEPMGRRRRSVRAVRRSSGLSPTEERALGAGEGGRDGAITCCAGGRVRRVRRVARRQRRPQRATR